MRFDIITIFPHIFDSYLNESMIKRARAKRLLDIRVHDLRKFSTDKHKKVDDRPYGGGPGMVIKLEPLVRALSSLKLKMKSEKVKVILFSASGKQFNAKMASEWAKKYGRVIMIAGHYEGVDQRIKDHLIDQEISVGDFITMGGEAPALCLIEAVTRLVPGVVGNAESLNHESFETGALEYPHYTRPRDYRGWEVPKVLISGDHEKVEAWRHKMAEQVTREKRPDLLKGKIKNKKTNLKI